MSHGSANLAVNGAIDVQDQNQRNDGEEHGPFAEEIELKGRNESQSEAK